jgi:hypothetical protein
MIAVNTSKTKNPLRNEIRKRLRQKMKKRRDTSFVKAMADRKWSERDLSKVPKQISDLSAPKAVIKESQKSLLDWLAYEPKPDVKFTPTSALPGSAEKIDVLAERYEQGLPLWHKLDFRYCGTDDPAENKKWNSPS